MKPGLTAQDGARYQLKDDPYSSHSVILSFLGEGAGRRLLDVGAADGFLAEILTARGWVVTALERDRSLAEQARGKCATVVVADLAEGVPALSGPFDVIVCADVLEHLSDPLATLRALRPSLSREGWMVVSVPNVAHLWVRLSLLLGRFDYTERGILDRTHLRFFTRRTFLALLAQAELAPDWLEVTPVPLPLVVPRRLHGAWLRATHTLGAWGARRWPRGLAYQFVAGCRFRSRPEPLATAAARSRAAAPSERGRG